MGPLHQDASGILRKHQMGRHPVHHGAAAYASADKCCAVDRWGGIRAAWGRCLDILELLPVTAVRFAGGSGPAHHGAAAGGVAGGGPDEQGRPRGALRLGHHAGHVHVLHHRWCGGAQGFMFRNKGVSLHHAGHVHVLHSRWGGGDLVCSLRSRVKSPHHAGRVHVLHGPPPLAREDDLRSLRERPGGACCPPTTPATCLSCCDLGVARTVRVET